MTCLSELLYLLRMIEKNIAQVYHYLYKRENSSVAKIGKR